MTVPEPTSRQTLSHLLNLFQQRGIKPKNKLGQNFLIDLNLLDLLLRSAELTRDDLVIEIGSGTGGLTARLAAQAGTVLSVEIDPAFHELTLEATAGCENVVAIRADVLRNKNELSPQVLSALAELRQKSGMHHLKVVANLPYAVATPFLSNLLLSDLPVEHMVVTVQWEIAERLLAVPATKAYGALAVLVQSLADVELVRRLPPSVFFPGRRWHRQSYASVPIPPSARMSATWCGFVISCVTFMCIAGKTCAAPWPDCPRAGGARKRSMRNLPSWGWMGLSGLRRWTSRRISGCVMSLDSSFPKNAAAQGIFRPLAHHSIRIRTHRLSRQASSRR